MPEQSGYPAPSVPVGKLTPPSQGTQTRGDATYLRCTRCLTGFYGRGEKPCSECGGQLSADPLAADEGMTVKGAMFIKAATAAARAEGEAVERERIAQQAREYPEQPIHIGGGTWLFPRAALDVEVAAERTRIAALIEKLRADCYCTEEIIECNDCMERHCIIVQIDGDHDVAT